MAEDRVKKAPDCFNVDYNNFDEKDTQGEYIYSFPYVISSRKKSWYLPKWTADEIKSAEETLTIYTDIPIECKGTGCKFKDTCPLIKVGKVNRWIGHGCPIETINAFIHFYKYVNDLDIRVEDYTDIQVLNDLIRLQIQMARCDKLIRKEDPTETMIAGEDTKTGLRHNVRQPNQLVEMQRRLRQDINKLYSTLLASRQSKADAESKIRSKTDNSNMMADLLGAARNKIKEEKEKAKKEEIGGSEEKPKESGFIVRGTEI
jgi:hypothetical protein